VSEQHTIETPENVSFAYDVAGIGSRFLAILIDSLIQGTVFAFLLIVFVLLEDAGVSSAMPSALIALVPVLLLSALFVVQFGYFLFFELITGGQTPGKQLFGLRVIKESGYPLSPLDSIIRNLVRIIDFFPFAYGVGIIVMFLNDRARRLGDFAAGTLVVKLRDDVRLNDLQSIPAAPMNLPDLPGLENLRASDVELIESFLERRATLRNSDKLAGSIASGIRARINTSAVDTHAATVPDEQFLRQVVAVYRRAHQGAKAL
jgi:uncharacterized RDD family membrane protein YckC